MAKNYFITGTDTDCGKTLVTAGLLHKAGQQQLRTLGLKPLAAGCEDTGEGLRNDDALLLSESASEKLAYQMVNPIALKAPIAPHIAAAQEGKRLTVDRLLGYVRGALGTPADLRLVEGAGGWRVPLNPMESLSGLPKALEMPVILVVGMRLGCLNHALLTAEAIRNDGLTLAGWVANVRDPQMPVLDENIGTLRALLGAPLLGVVPPLENATAAAAADHLSIEPLLGE